MHSLIIGLALASKVLSLSTSLEYRRNGPVHRVSTVCPAVSRRVAADGRWRVLRVDTGHPPPGHMHSGYLPRDFCPLAGNHRLGVPGSWRAVV